MSGNFNNNIDCRIRQNYLTPVRFIAAVGMGIMFLTGGSIGLRAQVRSKPTSTAAPATYEGLVLRAKQQLLNRNPEQAKANAEKAIRLDGKRYEAHVLLAAALRDGKQFPMATQHLQTALGLAPNEARPEILRAVTELRMAGLQPDGRRKLDALLLIVEDANKAGTLDERKRLLREFLAASVGFLDDHPFVAELWMLRATVAVELNRSAAGTGKGQFLAEAGWTAGHKLFELGLGNSDNLAVRKVMAELERNKWLNGPFPSDTSSGWKYYAISTAALWWCTDSGGSETYQPQNTSTTYAQALKYYKRLAGQGSINAESQLAFMYANGLGVKQDLTEAARWARSAAIFGEPNSELWLGQSFLSGQGGLRRDPAEAVRWLRKAAAQDLPDAERLLGLAYRRGEGFLRNDAEGLRLFKRATQHSLEQADSIAQNNLAWAFATDAEPLARDGEKALQLALAACLATSYKEGYMVDTLAAAYAETGDWDKAVANQVKAVELVRIARLSEETILDYQLRLDLYRKKEPYRQPRPDQ